MCGIACIVDKKNVFKEENFDKFIDTVFHRGPDSGGTVFFSHSYKELSDKDNRDNFLIGMGHRRLSILDLSEAGAQPMCSDEGDIVIVYNGEIYNFIELREELKKHGFSFHSNCDTEVIIAAYRHWGKSCVKFFNGMWAFVIFDRKRKSLVISRDRIGIKPLYYCYPDRDTLLIASEIKQILSLPFVASEPNHKVCISYLLSGHEDITETFFKNIYAFPAGHFCEIYVDNLNFKPERYWFPYEIKIDSKLTVPDAVEIVKARFENAVKLRLRSDVTVGGCLSGGLDSSSIFCQMSRLQPHQTFAAFSSCFNGHAIDEQEFMAEIIRHTNTKHFKVFPSSEEFLEDFDAFLKAHDEPVGSISVYAQNKVMEKARQEDVTVLLDGQGGDELFSGYWVAYLQFLNYCRQKGKYIKILFHMAGSLLPGGNSQLISNIFSHYTLYQKRKYRILPFTIKKEFLNISLREWHKELTHLSPAEYRIKELTEVYLPRYLKWEDRNSMRHSIESRVPFLDVDLISAVLSIPSEMNMYKGWNKYLFRLAMKDILPEKIRLRRDKLGFETPQVKWLSEGPFFDYLKSWAALPEHPVLQYIETDFTDIKDYLRMCELPTSPSQQRKNFDSLAIFRLFCLDKWLQNI